MVIIDGHSVMIDDDHTYYVDGIVTPGVTEILKAGGYGNPQDANGYTIPDEVIDNAAERGVMIAKAIELYNDDSLDWDTVDEELVPYIQAYESWCEKTGFVPVAQEELIYVPKHGYCGTLDIRGYINDRLTIIDIKTGSAGLKPWHRYQLAAYAYPFKEKTTWPDRIMLHLKSNGKAKQHPFTRETAQRDWTVFLACYTLYQAKILDGSISLKS